MASKGDVWAACSQDFDSLLFGAPKLVRNLNITGRRKLPGSKQYRDISIEIIELKKVLEANGLRDRLQLIDLAILMGTDFNKGIRGIGPKKGLKLIREHGDIEHALAAIGEAVPNKDEIRKIFTSCEKFDDYDLTWRKPDKERIIDMMCNGYGFSESRVSAALERLEREKRPPVHHNEPVLDRSQASLDKWN